MKQFMFIAALSLGACRTSAPASQTADLQVEAVGSAQVVQMGPPPMAHAASKVLAHSLFVKSGLSSPTDCAKWLSAKVLEQMGYQWTLTLDSVGVTRTPYATAKSGASHAGISQLTNPQDGATWRLYFALSYLPAAAEAASYCELKGLMPFFDRQLNDPAKARVYLSHAPVTDLPYDDLANVHALMYFQPNDMTWFATSGAY